MTDVSNFWDVGGDAYAADPNSLDDRAYSNALTDIYGARLGISESTYDATQASLVEGIRSSKAQYGLSDQLRQHDIASEQRRGQARQDLYAHDTGVLKRSLGDLSTDRDYALADQEVNAYNAALRNMYGSGSSAGFAQSGDRQVAGAASRQAGQIEDTYEAERRKVTANIERVGALAGADKADTAARVQRAEINVDLQRERHETDLALKGIDLALSREQEPLAYQQLLGQQEAALIQRTLAVGIEIANTWDFGG